MRRVLKAIGWTLGGIGGLAVLIVGVGFALPVRHSVTLVRDVNGTPQEVWDVITGIEDLGSWRTDIDRAVRLDPIEGWPAWREEGPSGPLTFAMAGAEPPTRLVTRIADEGLPFGGAWTYRLEATQEGTRVTITEDGFVSNPIFRLVSRFVIGHERTLTTYLDALEARMRR